MKWFQRKGAKQPNEYFITPFPTTHNPLIGTLQIDTLTNVHDALCALRTFAEVQGFGINENVATGLHILMTCIIKAVEFEMKDRQ